MNEVKVKIRFSRIAPRKVRQVLPLIKGKKATKVLAELQFMPWKAARKILLLLKSGLAAAKEKNLNEDALYVKNITCDEGPRLKRRRLLARGRSAVYQHRMSHLTLVLAERSAEEPEKIVKPLAGSPTGVVIKNK